MKSRMLFVLLVSLLIIRVDPLFCEDKDLLKEGISDYEKEDYEEAIETLKRARNQDPLSAKAAYYLGLSLKETQDFKEAKTHLKDSTLLDPELKAAYYHLAEALYYLEENNEALTELRTAEAKGFATGSLYLLKGLIFSKSDRNEEAIDAFKKAKELDPRLSQQSDYLIGTTLLKERKLKEAKEVFKEVIVVDPNADLARYAESYVSSIEKKEEAERPFRLGAGIRYEYDDNVLLKPSDASIATGITGEKDRRAVATFSAEYNFLKKAPWGAKLQYSLYNSDHDDVHTHDVESHTLSLVPTYSFKNSLAGFSLSFNHTLVDDGKYLDTISLNPFLNVMHAPTRMCTLSLRVRKKAFLETPFTKNEDRDSTDIGLGIGYFLFFARNTGFVNLRYELTKEDTDGANWEYIGNKGSVNVIYPFLKKFKFQTFLEADSKRFDEKHTVFNKTRRDKTYTLSALLSYEFYKNTNFIIQYTRVRDDSNIAVYDYTKHIYSSGIELRY